MDNLAQNRLRTSPSPKILAYIWCPCVCS